jgi:hypothetical protein
MSADEDDDHGGVGDGFSPVLAIPFGSMIGTGLGVLVGALGLADLAMSLVAGSIVGLLVGVVVFALLSTRGEGDGPPPP